MANDSLKENPKDGSSFVTLDLTLDVEHFEKGAYTVLGYIRPDWSPGNVGFRNFTEGITNKLVGCFLKSNPKDVILIRVNGEGTEYIIDRKAEIETFQLLYSVKFGPPLYAVFKNGMAYGFFHGEPLNEKLVREEKVALLIAEEMVRLHNIQPPSAPPLSECQSYYPIKTQRFLNLVPTKFDDPEKQAKFLQSVPSLLGLQTELNEICQQLQSMKMPVVLCHNDLLLKNIVFNREESTVHFIDYEYAFLNYAAFDIGNHFAEYAGVDEVNYDLYPDKDYQLKWLRNYLRSDFKVKGKSPDEVTDVDVERLYIQVNKCACASHFFWGLWALIQAKNSSIDFDFVEFSVARLNEYFRRKKEFFSMTLP